MSEVKDTTAGFLEEFERIHASLKQKFSSDEEKSFSVFLQNLFDEEKISLRLFNELKRLIEARNQIVHPSPYVETQPSARAMTVISDVKQQVEKL
ncbi:MAG: hypothetical protein HQ530_02805 [Parcubacteria group bacterium]|nr:hypothetical protein [Parcubacteria group bacterium]